MPRKATLGILNVAGEIHRVDLAKLGPIGRKRNLT